MRVQIVGNKNNLLCPLIQHIGSVPEDLRKIQRCPAFCHNRFPPACQRLGNYKDICNTITDIHGIHLFRSPGFTGQTDFLYHLLIRFVYADNRVERIISSLVNFQYILHFCHKFSICLRNTPFLYKPRFDFVFFITSQTVLSVI